MKNQILALVIALFPVQGLAQTPELFLASDMQVGWVGRPTDAASLCLQGEDLAIGRAGVLRVGVSEDRSEPYIFMLRDGLTITFSLRGPLRNNAAGEIVFTSYREIVIQTLAAAMGRQCPDGLPFATVNSHDTLRGFLDEF